MTFGTFNTPTPVNEPVKGFLPGSPEKASIKASLDAFANQQVDIPVIIGGEEIRTGNTVPVVMPHDHQHSLGQAHLAGPQEIALAMDAATKAKAEWERMPWNDRVAVFLRAAELLRTSWRDTLNVSTMLGQSKTVHQAEIDAACELIDFFRFNAAYVQQLYGEQPQSAPGIWNRLEHRPLDGFILAITPFNFTSIAANLPSAPAMLGNTALWKPSSDALYSGYYLMKLFEEAGLPPGVINYLPSRGSTMGNAVFSDPRFAGLHFTGSSGVFNQVWGDIGQNIGKYNQYPRIVGETGGKDFVFAHPSANVEALTIALVRGAFEYQGQKCSAASRAYIPKSLWPAVKEGAADIVRSFKMGDVRDFTNFMGAVINKRSFDKQHHAIEGARASSEAEIIVGGKCDDSKGYFVEPTIIRTDNPRYETMQTELFGPVLTVYVYDDANLSEALDLCANSSNYALTGAIFAHDRKAIAEATDALRFAAGNFYVNDKPTGAVVGQQPFGGSRQSGTNDKAGSILNLLRWVSPRTIKENLNPPTDWRYGFLDEA